MESNGTNLDDQSSNYPPLPPPPTENTTETPSNETEVPSLPNKTDVPQQQVSLPLAESDFNFWQVNNYKRTVKRVDDGAKLCDDFMKMVSERAEIEALYATKIQGWSKKWVDLLSKGPEYGTCKMSWLNIITEANDVAQLHSDLHTSLLSHVHDSISTWKATNYHKSLLSWKETKNAEEGFSKGQKPWAKKNDEVTKCKKAYYGACRARDQAEKLYSTADSSTLKEEQIKKLKDKFTKCEGDVSTTQDKYKEAIRDITNYNPKYKEDMCFVFDKLQTFEEGRKVFFKKTMQSLCQTLTMEKYFQRFTEIYNNLSNQFEKTEPAADIAWWASTYGTDVPIKWLEFEEYVPNADSDQEVQTQKQVSNGSDPPKKAKSSVCTTL